MIEDIDKVDSSVIMDEVRLILAEWVFFFGYDNIYVPFLECCRIREYPNSCIQYCI